MAVRRRAAAARRRFIADSLSHNFERFSTRFGNAIPNPDLEPERALNYEIGWALQPTDGLNLLAAVFYADIEDMIQTVVASAGPPQISQTRNVGDGESTASSSGVQSQLTELWRVTANYTYLAARDNGRLTARL